MDHIELATQRLILRPLRLDDWPALHRMTSDAEVQRYISGAPLTETQTRELSRMLTGWQAEHPPRARVFTFGRVSDGAVIGFGGLYWGRERWQAEVGYTLRRDAWGQGYASEAARALVRYGFEQLGLHRIFAECHPDNKGSERVMRRLGMRYEGRMVEAEWANGTWWDLLHYAILEREWARIL